MKSLKKSHYENSGWISKFSFFFLWPLARKARHDPKRLELKDFESYYSLNSKYDQEQLNSCWRLYGKGQPRLSKVIAKAFGLEYFFVSLISLINDCILEPLYFYFATQLIYQIDHYPQLDNLMSKINSNSFNSTMDQPLTSDLNSEINYIKAMLTQTNYRNQIIVSGLKFSLLGAFVMFLVQPYNWRIARLNFKVRTYLMQIIYVKMLSCDKSTILGQKQSAINLMAKDLHEQLDLSNVIGLVSGPIESIVLVTLLARELGANNSLWMFCLINVILITRILMKSYLTSKYYTKLNDARCRLIEEVFRPASKTMFRLYSWTSVIQKRIYTLRSLEFKEKRHDLYLIAYDSFIFFSGYTLISMLTILFGYYVLGIKMNRVRISQIILVVTIQRRIMFKQFVSGWSQYQAFWSTLRRCQAYLSIPEVSPVFDRCQDPFKIIATNLTSFWPLRGPEKPILTNINFRVKSDELVLVTGKVGSAKSSLLKTILGELSVSSGSLQLSSNGCRISYCSQEITLTQATIRDNILFNSAMDKRRYDEILQICSLVPDLNRLPQLDLTKVGESGLRLNGGLKARINLARCLYQKADIYLLDDPLSNVNSQICQHIFHRAIKGFLANKTVLFVTQQLQFSSFVDKLLILYRVSSAQTKEPTLNSYSSEFGTLDEILGSVRFCSFGSEQLRIQLMLANEKSKSLLDKKCSNNSIIMNDDEVGRVDPEQMIMEKNCFRKIEQLDCKYLKDFLKFDTENNNYNSSGNSHDKLSSLPLITRDSTSEFGYFYKSTKLASISWFVFILTSFLASMMTITMVVWLVTYTNVRDTRLVPFGFLSFILKFSFDQVSQVSLTFLLILTILAALRLSQFVAVVKRASWVMHQNVISKCLNSKTECYDNRPAGESIIRLISDLFYMDARSGQLIDEMTMQGTAIVFILCVIIITQVRMLLNLAFVFVIAYCLQKLFYMLLKATSMAESQRRSDFYTHLTHTIDNLTLIRCSEKEATYMKRYAMIQDHLASIWFLESSLKSLVLNVMNFAMLSFMVTLVVYDIHDAFDGKAKYAFININFIVVVIRLAQTTIASWLEFLTKSLESTRRLKEFCDLESEFNHSSPDLVDQLAMRKNLVNLPLLINNTFPRGELRFIGVSLKYPAKNEIVLKNLSFKINPGEKIGVVGRTGAGKSSLISVLFRLYHFEGFVYIDNQDIKKLSLSVLRKSISVIPQDPILLSGSLRFNLDPEDEFSDEQLWLALDLVQMKDYVLKQPNSLITQVQESGSNFSLSQRQLICLARALLNMRTNKLLILDEATTNFDPETNGLIQKLIHSRFKNCTVITIAHRLSNILDSDKIMVLDRGRLKEFGSVSSLVKLNGLFTEMMAHSGSIRANNKLKEQQRQGEAMKDDPGK